MDKLIHISEAVNIAIHALVYIAHNPGDRYISVSEIAEKLNVSESHLAKVMQKLVKKDFVISSRGAKGGFSLKENIPGKTILDVLTAIEGDFIDHQCLLGASICDSDNCMMELLFHEVREMVEKRLGSIKISDFKIKKQ